VPDRPPPPPKDLDEVERALSVLEGRHPEHERTRRETLAAAETRRHQLEKELAAGSRRRVRRTIVLGANLVALAVAAVVGWRVVSRAHVLRAALAHAEAPFVAHGMTEVTSNELSARSAIETDAPAAACFVAIATAGDVEAQQGTMTVHGKASAGWCACEGGHVTVRGAEGGGIALLQIDAHGIGGPLARPWSSLAPSAWSESGAECADSMLDAWLAGHGGHGAPVEPGWLATTPERASLGRLGFRVLASVDAKRPFGAVDSTAGDCMLAVAEGPDELSLRATGGARRITKAQAHMAWCSSAAETTTVWRAGVSRVVVLAAPSGRIGGLLGAREVAEIGGMPVAADAAWLSDGDLAWDAASLMHSSGFATLKNGDLPSGPGDTTADVVGITRAPGASIATSPDGVVTACDPALDTAGERAFVCAGSAPVSWWRRNDAPAAMAHAALPFWLSLLQSHREPDAIARIPELLALSRRLLRDGFEATGLEGVTELPDGVRVVGRAHEDAIVAVGLLSKAPWTVPYTDGTPWDLGDTPRIVALEPGLAVKLSASPMPSTAPDKRRTVVFRHGKRD
jgi:hypothetical protein